MQRFDWGQAISTQPEASQLHWVAFFGDVDHQVERVGMGARVTVTYLLRRDAEFEPSPTIADEDLARKVKKLDRGFRAAKRGSS